MSLRIILDTDPGIDDALALFLALASPEIQLEAVTTVSGNVSIEHTTRNALALLELTGRMDIPVARGCARPLVSQPVQAAHVHGKNGLGEITLPEPGTPLLAQHAIDVIAEKVLAAPGEITLVAVGPLTNLAMAIRRSPEIVSAVREVVLMGGALRVPGNVTPAAEFNIFADAHAAHIVLHAGWPLRMVTLDATTRALLKRELVNELAANGGPVPTLIKHMIDYYCDVFGKALQLNVFQMHDPLCVAAVFRPDLLTWQRAYVDVELTGTRTFGETVATFEIPGRSVQYQPNVLASTDVDNESFIQLYLERIRQGFAKVPAQ